MKEFAFEIEQLSPVFPARSEPIARARVEDTRCSWFGTAANFPALLRSSELERELPCRGRWQYTSTAWAEDRATRGRDPSAVPGAKTGVGGRMPPLCISGIGRNAINPFPIPVVNAGVPDTVLCPFFCSTKAESACVPFDCDLALLTTTGDP